MTVSLRERKVAMSKKRILESLLERMKNQSYESIKISELCQDAVISQASFYNYFPKKKDLLVYYIQIWSIETQWLSEHKDKAQPGLEFIQAIFSHTAKVMQEHPGIMPEITAFQARNEATFVWPRLTLADKREFFPDYSGIEQYKENGLNDIFPKHIQEAITSGELPKNTDQPTVLLSLATLFFGIPMLATQAGLDADHLFKKQLSMIWAGVRAMSN